MSKLSKRGEGYVYGVFIVSALICLWFSWKIGLTFFLGIGAIAQLVKLVTGKSFWNEEDKEDD